MSTHPSLAVNGGTTDILNVSTYPTFNTTQPVSRWAQPPTSGAFTAAATYPAANNYYQQQVLVTAKAP